VPFCYRLPRQCSKTVPGRFLALVEVSVALTAGDHGQPSAKLSLDHSQGLAFDAASVLSSVFRPQEAPIDPPRYQYSFALELWQIEDLEVRNPGEPQLGPYAASRKLLGWGFFVDSDSEKTEKI
jgi:hypothetical protein